MPTRFVSLLVVSAAAAVAIAPAQTADDFFNPDAVHDIYITAPDWVTLQQNFNDDTYYPADVRWNDQLIAQAGIRSKGRVSRRAAKPSLKVDIDRFQDQEFLGLKAFTLDNNIQDFTMLKERMAMLLFGKMGLPAPRQTHARVYVNGEYLGLFMVSEDIDKRFLKRTLGEDSGYLYEIELMEGFYLNYLGDDPELYSPFPFKPETKESSPEPGPIVEMIRAINLSSDEEFEAEVSKYIDVKAYLTQIAVENYITESDGLTASYGVNNAYFYRFNGKTLGFFMPKDKDNAFNAADWPVMLNSDLHPLWRRAMQVPAWRQHYFDELLRVASVAGGADGWLETEFRRLATLIRPAALEDRVKECPDGACTLDQSNYYFDMFVDFVAGLIRERPAYVAWEVGRLVAGEPEWVSVNAYRSVHGAPPLTAPRVAAAGVRR